MLANEMLFRLYANRNTLTRYILEVINVFEFIIAIVTFKRQW